MTAFLVREDDWYVARAVEVDVAVRGKTVEQALAYLREALEAYFETQPVPDGLFDGAIIAPVPVHIRR
jgi:predicted RNase H-like HicB family nuclease